MILEFWVLEFQNKHLGIKKLRCITVITGLNYTFKFHLRKHAAP